MRVTGVEAKKCTFQRRGRIKYGVMTQAARKFRDVGVLELTPTVYSKFLSVLAARSEVVAQRLKALGLPEKITPRALVKKCGDVFTHKGLVDGCVRDISNSCMEIGLDPRNISVFSFLRRKGVKRPLILDVLQQPDDAQLGKRTRNRKERFEYEGADASDEVLTGTEEEIREAQIKLVAARPLTKDALNIRRAEAKRCTPTAEALANIQGHLRGKEEEIRAFCVQVGEEVTW